MSPKKVVTRFAPSPTGFVHVGGVRTALYAFLFAKKYNGDFILRIEDTDRAREVPGAVDQIMGALRWVLGDKHSSEITDPWTYGPNKPSPIFGSCVQSERTSIYTTYAKKLLEAGYAYSDPYSEDEVENFRKKSEENKKPFLFREYRPAILDQNWDTTKALRLKVPEITRSIWHDAVRGDLAAGPEALDDFILIKSDSFPTYNFCHVIDDIEMGVTHVMRGEEFIPSTPKFLALYKIMQEVFPEKNIELPTFVTLPPILDESGTKKLSKRDGAKDVLDYKKDGYLPQAFANYLALQGWNPGTEREVFSLTELIAAFSVDRIHKSGATWNEEKLLWLNKEYLKKLSFKEQFDYVKPELETSMLTSDENLAKALPYIIERIQVAKDIKSLLGIGEFAYLFMSPEINNAAQLTWKKDASLVNTKMRLSLVQDLLEKTDSACFENTDNIKKILMPLAEKEGRGEVLWPLRIALSGQEKSIDPFAIISVIGKTESLNRIEKAILML